MEFTRATGVHIIMSESQLEQYVCHCGPSILQRSVPLFTCKNSYNTDALIGVSESNEGIKSIFLAV